jgi:hypothetical protein
MPVKITALQGLFEGSFGIRIIDESGNIETTAYPEQPGIEG